MPTDKIRKYILPNIPYLFIGWACLKPVSYTHLSLRWDHRVLFDTVLRNHCAMSPHKLAPFES